MNSPQVKTPETRKKIPVTLILSLACLALVLAGLVGGGVYLDFHAGSTSSSFLPNGMEVSAISRGFNSGPTALGSVIEGEQQTLVLKVAEKEFQVTESEVICEGEQLAKVSKGTQQLSIVSYRGSTSIEADGKKLATVP